MSVFADVTRSVCLNLGDCKCGGEIVAGPMRNEQGILYAEIDSQRTGIAKRVLDITGHYARPDIFQLHVNTQPQSPVKFD